MTSEAKVKAVYPDARCIGSPGGGVKVHMVMATVGPRRGRVLGTAAGDSRRAWAEAARNLAASEEAPR